MAKKHKKRQKQTRRARQQQGSKTQTTGTAPVAASVASTKVSGPTQSNPLANTNQPAEPTQAPAQPAKPVGASFTPRTRRGPDGIDAELAATEYPAVKRDLRKLGLTIAAFVALLAGLSVLANTTSAVRDLGHNLFQLWQ